MKHVLVFFAVFLFIHICSIYVMGGFFEQTQGSKGLTMILALVVAGCVTGIYHDYRDKM